MECELERSWRGRWIGETEVVDGGENLGARASGDVTGVSDVVELGVFAEGDMLLRQKTGDGGSVADGGNSDPRVRGRVAMGCGTAHYFVVRRRCCWGRMRRINNCNNNGSECSRNQKVWASERLDFFFKERRKAIQTCQKECDK